MGLSGVRRVMELCQKDPGFWKTLRRNPEKTVQRRGAVMGADLDEDEWTTLQAVDWSMSNEQLREQANTTILSTWPVAPFDKVFSTSEEPTSPPASSAQRNFGVVERAEELALNFSCTPLQRRLLRTALQGFKTQTLNWELPPFIGLPMLIYGSLRGNQEPAVPLAVATSFTYLGADILDDLADGDLPSHWEGYNPWEINLAGVTLLCVLPQLILAELDVPPTCRLAMQRSLAWGYMRMSAGQQRDLVSADVSNISAEDVEASVAAKSGEEVALFAILPAQMAEAPADVVSAYADLGRALGTGGQLNSDYHDLFVAKHSRDLASGTRTLPIALHLEDLVGDEREEFLTLLNEAREDTAVHRQVRERLVESFAFRYFLFRIEVHHRRALRALKRVGSRASQVDWLQAEVESLSLLRYSGRHADS